MTINKRIEGFVKLGNYLKEFVSEIDLTRSVSSVGEIPFSLMGDAVMQAERENPWFTRENIHLALKNIAISLEKNAIERFAEHYEEKLNCLQPHKKIAVVMAGNIPLVGFHDFFCVMMTRHDLLGKLSTDDSKLLPAIAEILARTDGQFRERIRFADMKIEDFDAVIATGSNNTYRYFDYYFGKFPHILRKNRNSIAVITGRETMKELAGLADDVFSFFGKGCRNVSKLFLPRGFRIGLLKDLFSRYSHLLHHHKYANNYQYYRTICILDKKPFLDLGHLILIEDERLQTPVSVLHYEFYDGLAALLKGLHERSDQIQCIVSSDKGIPGAVMPGTTQNPGLDDFADGVDTMDFLLDL